MIYTYYTKKALNLCFQAHKDQVDKAGMPYVFHPFHIAEQMTTEDTIVTALLHDVAEDTYVTVDYMETVCGFKPAVIEALRLLTHEKNVPYLDYIRKLKDNPIAREVKLADLKHNSDVSRLEVIEGNMLQNLKKYKKAIAILEE